MVKEKDELIVALQEAVASAYRDAMAQQELDNKGLEQLHQMLLSRDGLTLMDVMDSLQVNAQPWEHIFLVTPVTLKLMDILLIVSY